MLIETRLLSVLFKEHVAKYPGMVPSPLRRADLNAVLRNGYVFSKIPTGDPAFLLVSQTKERLLAWLYRPNEQTQWLCADEMNPPVSETHPVDATLTLFEVRVDSTKQSIHVLDLLMLDNCPIFRYCITIRLEFARKRWSEWLEGNGHPMIRKVAFSSSSSSSSSKPWDDFALPSGYPHRAREHITFRWDPSWPPRHLVPSSMAPWRLNLVPYFPMVHLSKVLAIWKPTVGCRLVQLLEGYRPFRSSQTACLEWKSRSCLTLDFQLGASNAVAWTSRLPEPDTSQAQWPRSFMEDTQGEWDILAVSKRGVPYPIARANFPPKFVAPDVGTIVRFRWAHRRWTFVGIRDERKFPDTLDTVYSALHTLREHVRREELAAL